MAWMPKNDVSGRFLRSQTIVRDSDRETRAQDEIASKIGMILLVLAGDDEK